MHFFSCLLCIIILFLLILYLHQSSKISQNNTITKIPSITKQPSRYIIYNQSRPRPWGPVINFHQSFTNNNIPELRMRNYYNDIKNSSNVKWTDQFEGTIIRNYLDNLDNVKNIYLTSIN